MPEPIPLKAEAFEEELDDLEHDMLVLQKRYEAYFLGLDRRTPERDRDQLKRRVLKANNTQVNNTALRFRANTLQARYLSLERMWVRTLKEIEDGTYRRDVFKAKLRSKTREEPAARPAPPTIADAQMKAIYDAYLLARQRTNEPVAGLTYDSLKKRIEGQLPELMKKHNSKAIDFKVVIKGGKALIRAVPREG